MRVFYFIIIFFWAYGTAYGQIAKGTMVDLNTSIPLSYVHIGIIGKNMGTISREDGSFEINLKDALASDTLAFSMIGYATKKLLVKEIGREFLKIQLKPIHYEIAGINISSSRIVKKSRKRQVIGAKKSVKTMTGGTGIGWGGEIGILIKNNQLFKATKVNVHLNSVTYDSILFRLNVYQLKNDMPGASILTKDVFLKALKEKAG